MKKLILLPIIIILLTLLSAKGQQCSASFDILKDSIIYNNPYAFFFIDKSTGNNIVSWTWDFGDNSPISTEQNPVHVFQHSGSFNICLTIKTKNNGVIDCQNKTCENLIVKVAPVNCVASFYYYNYNKNNDSTVTNQSSSNTYYFIDNSNGNLSKWFWDFGDGSKSNERNPIHSFGPGTFHVCLTIEGLTGDSSSICQDTYCETFTIEPTQFCQSDFYSYSDTLNNLSFHFIDLSAGIPDKWFWDFGDNKTSNVKNPTHVYTTQGIYNVCLTIVNDTIGCTDIKCYTIFAGIEQQICQAGFTYYPDSSQISNYTYTFINKSKGNAKNVLWSFGDGNISQEQNPKYDFKHSGVFQVCLSISDTSQNGCSETYCATIFVGEKTSSCKAFFNASIDLTANTPNLYKFTDLSSGIPNKWYWNFGDGVIDSTQSPWHQYLNSGIYYPCLTIINMSTGCKDTYCSEIFIMGNGANSCQAQFSYMLDPTVVSLPTSEVYYFTDNSKGNISTWYWDFGDGTKSKEKNPMHIFLPGTFKVCLTISSFPDQNNICTDTYCTILSIDSIPPPPFNLCNNYIIHTNDINDSLAIQFYGNSQYSQPPIKYFWKFGDGDSSHIQNPLHKYKHNGTYIVTLSTSDSTNCTASSTQTVFAGTQLNNGHISGQIFAGNKNADKAIIIIASWDFTANYFTYFDTTYVDSLGGYHFNKLPFGNYYVLAVPVTGSKFTGGYIATYYGDLWDWAKAKTIEVGENMPAMQYDIHLLPYQNFASGPGIIEGYVAYGGIKPMKKNNSLSGIEVLLFDLSDNILAYTYTDDKGLFQFNKLAYGTYKVYLEIFGISSTAALVTISENNQIVDNIGFNVDNQVLPFLINVSTNDITNINDPKISNVYPNPLTDIANISVYLIKGTQVKLAVYNQLGQVLYTQDDNIGQGLHTIQINTSKLSEGFYSVSVKSKDGINCVRKFVK